MTPDCSIERMAIDWLHVLNEHPSNLRKYSNLLAGLPTESAVAQKSAAMQLQQWVRERSFSHTAAVTASPVDLLFVSHLLHPSLIGAAEDFYFGHAPEALAAKGPSTCVMLRNHTTIATAGLDSRWPATMARRIVLPDTLGFRREFNLRRALAAEARRLRASSPVERHSLDKKVWDEAGRQAQSMASVSALRFFHQITEWITALQPKALVVTFEGHAWERLAFAAAHVVRPDTFCVGYHHPILFPRQHAALRPLGGPFDPDVILTAGTISEQRFRSAYSAQPITVATMGKHRRQPTDERQSAVRSGCLVIPDGILSEVVPLFDFALEAARQAPEISFVLRLHPVMSQQDLTRRHPRFNKLPKNVAFSSVSIEEEFKRARCALYRGSSSSINAVIAGLRPFYVHREGELSIDPLHSLQTWRKIVSSPTEFITLMKQDCDQPEPARTLEAAAAVKFCQDYFMPFDLNTLFDALSPALRRLRKRSSDLRPEEMRKAPR